MTFFTFILLLVTNISTHIYAYTTSYTLEKKDPHTQKITLSFDLKPDEFLYKDNLTITTNNPAVTLSPITIQNPASQVFDQAYGSTKEVYKNKALFTFQAQKNAMHGADNTIIHVHFSTTGDTRPQQLTIPLDFTREQPETITAEAVQEPESQAYSNYTPQHPASCEVPQPSLIGGFIQKIINYFSSLFKSWKAVLASLFTSTGSQWIRLIAALILGILLSLTPCIYPMIPITIGVLQANQTKSSSRNFLMAGAYTLGISTTFAILGLIASIGSCVFGQLQGSPWLIILLVIILGYLGLAMFGLYEMHIPRFLQSKTTNVQGGSFLSAFTFGAVSGTVASPCMSPGLALILDWVSNLSKTGSAFAYAEGFALLFVFGIGSSLPLLIIGTFSTSVNLLPRAGLWMVEVKKILGLMLIGMCFYHLSHLERYIPWHILVWFIVAALIFFGIYYFATVQPYDSKAIKWFKNFMGTVLLIAACVMGLQGYKAVYNHLYTQEIPSVWLNNYAQAHAQALKENKLLFIDIGATYCGACKVLDSTIFKNTRVLEALNKYILVKINADVHEEAYNQVIKLFGDDIKGYPTLLIINSAKNQVIKKWGVEINELSIDGLVEQLAAYSRL